MPGINTRSQSGTFVPPASGCLAPPHRATPIDTASAVLLTGGQLHRSAAAARGPPDPLRVPIARPPRALSSAAPYSRGMSPWVRLLLDRLEDARLRSAARRYLNRVRVIDSLAIPDE